MCDWAEEEWAEYLRWVEAAARRTAESPARRGRLAVELPAEVPALPVAAET